MSATATKKMNSKQALALVGSIGKTSKMPGRSWGISAQLCNVGSKLHKVENSVCNDCYALKSFYRYPSVTKSHATRLRLFSESLDNDNGDSWVLAMATLIRDERYFRFLDSGDLQSLEMLECFVRVAQAVPDCLFWIPTREYSIVSAFVAKHGSFPANVTLRLSALMVNGPAPKGLAKRLGVSTSGVSSTGDHNCQAVRNDNECGDCRKCWLDKGENIIYKKH